MSPLMILTMPCLQPEVSGLKPVTSDSQWSDILEVYHQGVEWPDIPLPGREMLLSTLLHTKDSAPGPDGLPCAAWRLLPEDTVDATMSYFYDSMDERALPPLQVGVWIPKAKMGPEAEGDQGSKGGTL